MGSDGHSKYPYFPKLVKVCKSNSFKKIAIYKGILLVFGLKHLLRSCT